jgi:hypothetical protein
VTLTTTDKTDDNQNLIHDENGGNRVLIGPGCKSGKHVTGYVLSLVVAGGKWCHWVLSLVRFRKVDEPTLILRPGQKRCGGKRLSPKTSKQQMLCIAAITNFIT